MYERFKVPSTAPYQSEYDIPSWELYDPVQRNTAPILLTERVRLDVLGTGPIRVAMPVAGRGFRIECVNNFGSQLTNVSGSIRINNDTQESGMPIGWGRGFHGSFYQLFAYIDRFPLFPPFEVYFYLTVYRSKFRPWEYSNL